MKRGLNDDDMDGPAAKRQKLDEIHENEEKEQDPSIIIPELKVSMVQNGIVHVDFLNIDSFYEQELASQQTYEFEIMYKRNDNEWKSVIYSSQTIMLDAIIYLKTFKDIKDYTLYFKVRSKLKTTSKWSLFCDELSILIKSSLIAHQFKVGQYVEFRDENEYYSHEGKIIRILSENKVRIRPFPKQFTQNYDSENEDIDMKNNENNDDDEWRNYADLGYFLDFDGTAENDGPLMENLAQMVDFGDDAMRMNAFRNYLLANKDKERIGDVDVHCSRLYGDGIRLSAVIDISDNERNVDKMILLRCNDEGIMDVFDALKNVFYGYVKDEKVECDEQYQLKYMARFVGKCVCDFLIDLDFGDCFSWKIGCLRDSNDGKMTLVPVRSDIIKARISGLKEGIHGMNRCPIDCVIGFCDICRLEISEYDWRYNCEQHITDKHDVCMTCAYNVINQYIQFNELLCPLLQRMLNDDCIQEITSFVVGSVVKL